METDNGKIDNSNYKASLYKPVKIQMPSKPKEDDANVMAMFVGTPKKEGFAVFREYTPQKNVLVETEHVI